MILSDGRKSGDMLPRSLLSFPIGIWRFTSLKERGIAKCMAVLTGQIFIPNCMTADVIGLVRF